MPEQCFMSLEDYLMLNRLVDSIEATIASARSSEGRQVLVDNEGGSEDEMDFIGEHVPLKNSNHRSKNITGQQHLRRPPPPRSHLLNRFTLEMALLKKATKKISDNLWQCAKRFGRRFVWFSLHRRRPFCGPGKKSEQKEAVSLQMAKLQEQQHQYGQQQQQKTAEDYRDLLVVIEDLVKEK